MFKNHKFSLPPLVYHPTPWLSNFEKPLKIMMLEFVVKMMVKISWCKVVLSPQNTSDCTQPYTRATRFRFTCTKQQACRLISHLCMKSI